MMVDLIKKRLPRLTLDNAVKLLRDVVEGNEDTHYLRPGVNHHGDRLASGNECFYVHSAAQRAALARDLGQVVDEDDTGDAPGCLIGAALHKHGVPLSEMYTVCSAYDLLVYLECRGFLTYEAGVCALFEDAQTYQDMGERWGSAVDMALEKMADRT